MREDWVRVFLFRHGETDWNVEERFQGHTDIPLNERGREQARSLIPVMRQNEIEVILSSDLGRARETGQIIADALGVPLFEEFDLREAHLGAAQGMTRQEIEREFGSELQSRWRSSQASDADVSYPGGETGGEIMLRAYEALERFIRPGSWQRLGVATHGGVIRRVMQKLLPPDSPPVAIPNGVVYEILYHRKNHSFFLPMQVPEIE